MIESGYTKIANEILEQLAKTNLNGTQRRILDVVFRMTYGYQRKEFNMSITYISKATDINKMQIQRELATLISRKIIIVISEATFSKSRVIAFNTNFNDWVLAKKLTVSETDKSTVSELVNSTVSGLANQIKKDKESIKENSANSFYEDLFLELWKLYPNKKGKSAVTKKSKETISKIGIEKMTKAIETYKNELQRETWKQAMNGSTFFNGRYEDYLQENYQEQQEAPTPTGTNLKELLLKQEAAATLKD